MWGRRSQLEGAPGCLPCCQTRTCVWAGEADKWPGLDDRWRSKQGRNERHRQLKDSRSVTQGWSPTLMSAFSCYLLCHSLACQELLSCSGGWGIWQGEVSAHGRADSLS